MISIKVYGIVCEYNPFHSGHKYQIDSIKGDCDAVVCVMSGNFVQRGEPSILPKHLRARHAILNGADLVIELPTTFAVSSAERFAYGAVYLLNSLNVITHMSFGSESGDIETLKNYARFLAFESDEYKNALKEELKKGAGFAKARENALSRFIGDTAALQSPNNILAIEYIKALYKLKSSIVPTTIKRAGAGYLDLSPKDGFCSSSAIRKMAKEGDLNFKNYVPHAVFEDLLNFPKPDDKILDRLVLYRVRNLDKDEARLYFDALDGLFERIYQNRFSSSLDELINNVKSKRHTTSRIKRLLIKMLLRDTLPKDLSPTYIRPLAMNKTGQALLNKIKKEASLPLVTKVGRLSEIKDGSLLLDILASDIYSLLSNTKTEVDFTTPLQIL